MKTDRLDETTHYQQAPGIMIISLRGSWKHRSETKPNPTFFCGPNYFGISRADAARTLKHWRQQP